MNKLITYETLRKFAYSNDRICKRPIRGIAVSFFGLGGAAMYAEDTEEGKLFAEQGILFVIPYTNPWAWMNRQAVCYTDEILDVLIAHENLSEDIPIVSSGGSMGGLAALVYTAKAKRTPAACVANCPVCDLPAHFSERDDLPRTLYSAFYDKEGDIAEVLKDASPVHLADKMPEARYTIFHCEEDKAVNKSLHSDVFVRKLRERFPVAYYAVPERGHCDLTPDMRQLYYRCISDGIAEKQREM